MGRPMVINNVIDWAIDRNLIKGSTHQAQFIKLVSEVGELNDALFLDPSRDDVKDAIGDILVVMIILCEQLELNFKENYEIVCVEKFKSYNPHNMIIGLISELGGMADIISKGKTDIIYNICSIIYVLNHVANLHKFTLDECLESAYNTIKNRKGKMIDGFFVKSA